MNSDLADSQNQRLSKEADALIAKSDKTKNPIAKNELLTQAIEKQTQADEIVVSALEENSKHTLIQDSVLYLMYTAINKNLNVENTRFFE